MPAEVLGTNQYMADIVTGLESYTFVIATSLVAMVGGITQDVMAPARAKTSKQSTKPYRGD